MIYLDFGNRPGVTCLVGLTREEAEALKGHLALVLSDPQAPDRVFVNVDRLNPAAAARAVSQAYSQGGP